MTVPMGALRKDAPAHMLSPFLPRQNDANANGATLPKHIPIYLPEVYPIPDAQEFNPSASRSTVAVETQFFTLTPDIRPNSDAAAGALTLPTGNIAIIRSFTISITNMLTTTNVTFSLLVNGGPVGGYGGISITPRVAPYVSNVFDCFIRVPSAAKIQVSFSNVDGGSYVVGTAMSGWFWPITSGQNWLQTGV